MFVNTLLIVSLVFVEVITAHDSYGSILAEQLNQYCALHVGGGRGVSNRSKAHEHRIGKAGPPGVAGPPGTIGRQGSIGRAGPIRPAGSAGPAGSTGPAGSVGSAGPSGPAGPVGLAGPAGLPGHVGSTGPAGPAGPVGSQGPSGVKGSSGVIDYDKIEEMMTKKIQSVFVPDCALFSEGFAKVRNFTGGVFDIYPGGYQSSTEVYCDLKTDGGRWTVFQRRMGGSVSFKRNWNDYVNGFGNLEGEFWMGLEKLHRLTSGKDLEVRFDLEDWEGNKAYAVYSTFSIGDASTKYRLSIGGYSGTAGDAMSNLDNMMFSTYDEDNDTWVNNCASTLKGGGWWFRACHYANLNGLYLHGSYSASYQHGIIWYEWKGWWYSLKFTEMKFRPKL